MNSFPHVRVDFKHRVLSVTLHPGTVHRTRQLDDAHLVDVDAGGQVVGIEVLTLDDLKIEAMAAEFGFSEQVPAIRAAIQKVFSPTGTGVSYGEPVMVRGVGLFTQASPHATTDESSEAPELPPLIP